VAGTVDKFKVTTVTMSIVTYFVAFVLVMLADRVAKLLEAIGPKLRLAYKEIGIAITRLFSREAKKGEENPTSTV
jgi:hypothetical protein